MAQCQGLSFPSLLEFFRLSLPSSYWYKTIYVLYCITTVTSDTQTNRQMSDLKMIKTQENHQNLQRSSSPSRSMTSRVTARSMVSTLVTWSAPATSTLPTRPLTRLEAKRRRARRLSPSRTCTLSSRPPRSPRTPVASTISLRSWSCTTRTKTRPSSTKISSGCWPISVIYNILRHFKWFSNLKILGEKLSKEEAKGLMTELCDPQDDDGFTPFMRKFLFGNFCSTFLFTGVSVNEVKTWLPFYSFLGKDVQVRRLNLSKRNISGEQKHPPRKKQIFQLFFNHFSFDGRMCSLTSKKIKNNLRWESLEFWTLFS